jgi:hypothetical protein
VDIRIRRIDPVTTLVRVEYQHTTLKSEFNPHTEEMAQEHRAMGPRWAEALEACLRKKGA